MVAPREPMQWNNKAGSQLHSNHSQGQGQYLLHSLILSGTWPNTLLPSDIWSVIPLVMPRAWMWFLHLDNQIWQEDYQNWTQISRKKNRITLSSSLLSRLFFCLVGWLICFSFILTFPYSLSRVLRSYLSLLGSFVPFISRSRSEFPNWMIDLPTLGYCK